jgi:hypothetical protein
MLFSLVDFRSIFLLWWFQLVIVQQRFRQVEIMSAVGDIAMEI